MLQLDTEGCTLVSALRYFGSVCSRARVLSDVPTFDNAAHERRDVARKALAYCRKRGISHWDFLEAVDS